MAIKLLREDQPVTIRVKAREQDGRRVIGVQLACRHLQR